MYFHLFLNIIADNIFLRQYLDLNKLFINSIGRRTTLSTILRINIIYFLFNVSADGPSAIFN